MKNGQLIVTAAAVQAFLLAGCFYDVDRSKIPDEDAGDGAIPDAGAADSGIGEACASDSDCAELEADYCLVDVNTQSGFCTIQDCTFAECPTGQRCPGSYSCCDCDIPEDFIVQIPSVCISGNDVDKFIAGFAAYGIDCTCG